MVMAIMNHEYDQKADDDCLWPTNTILLDNWATSFDDKGRMNLPKRMFFSEKFQMAFMIHQRAKPARQYVLYVCIDGSRSVLLGPSWLWAGS